MPAFYNFRQNGLDYSFDDIFVPADLFREGNLWTWGSGSNGQLGDNTTSSKNTPVTTFTGGTNWKQVSCGNYHAAAIKTDGTLWTWGSGYDGRLGTNDTSQRLTPVTTFAGGTNWKQVSAGGSYTAAIKTDGTLWTWGSGFSGYLGTNNTNIRATPVTTFAGGTNWKQVSAGTACVAAIKTDGTLWAWGNGVVGAMGNAQSSNKCTPVTTFAGGNNWKQVAAGRYHIGAIKNDGTLWIWGYPSNGALGNAVISGVMNTPVTTFAGGTNWKQISANGYYTAAIKTDGTLWTWGRGSSGMLGNNSTSNVSTPVTTFAGGSNWKQVNCGLLHMSSIKTDGTLWTWGSGSNGSLGTNDTTQRNTPVTTFAGGTNWKQVSCGFYQTAALTYIDPVL